MARVIDAVIRLKDDFTGTLKRVKGDLDSFETKTEKLSNSFYSTSRGLKSVSRAFMPATLAIGAGVTASVKAHGEFETALIGVQKVTKMSSKEMEKMTDDIKKLTREIPKSATEITGVAEAAGRLGISKEHILDFTKTMSEMGMVSNLASEEAADIFARFANITQMSEDNFSRLGSTVVALGSNMATTESEIANMALNIAAAGSQVGMTEDQIMAMSATLSALGLEAQAGGSSMSRVLAKVNKAVALSGKELDSFAKVAGVSAQEFAQAWESAPNEALVMLTEGLGRAQEGGENLDMVLEELGITGLREVDMMKRLAGSGDTLADAFDLAGDAWSKNTELAEMAAAAYESFENQVKFLKNALFEVGEVVATHVLPVLEPIISKVTDLARSFVEADEGTQKFILKVLALVAAIALVAGILSGVFYGINRGFMKLHQVTKRMKGGESFINALLGPAGKFLVVALLIAGAGYLIYRNWDKIKPVIDKVKDAFSGVAEALEPYKEKLLEIFGDMASRIKGWVEPVVEYFKALLPKIGDFVMTVIDSFALVAESVAPKLGGLALEVVEVFKAIFDVFSTLAETIAPYIGESILIIIEAFNQVLQFINNVFSGNWSGAWNNVKNIAKLAIDFIKNMWDMLVALLSIPLKPVVDMIYDKFKSGYEWVKDKWNSLKSFLSSPIRGVVNMVTRNSEIGQNARGTDNWRGGLTWVGEEGPELINLPRRTRVHTATSSRRIAKEQVSQPNNRGTVINIPKLADHIVVREDADIDRIIEGLYRKLRLAEANRVRG